MAVAYMRRARAVRCIALAALACDGDDVRIIKDSGTLCLTQSGTEIRIDAQLDACDGSCNVIRHASCEAELTPAGIVISSRVEQEDISDEVDTCNTECSPTSAACSITVLAEGSVGVAFGGEETTIELPRAEPLSLFGREPDLCESLDELSAAMGTVPFTGALRGRSSPGR